MWSLLGAIALGAESTPDSNPAPKRVSLEDAKKYAILHNSEVLERKRAFEVAQAKVGLARSRFYPHLGVVGGGDTRFTSAQNQTVGVAYAYANYNIFNGWADSRGLDLAEEEREQMRVKWEKAKFRVGLAVERAYHQYVYKQDVKEIKKEAITLNHRHQKMAKRRRASGLVVNSDVMEFEMASALLQSDMVLLEQELHESRIELKKLLGEQVGGAIRPVGTLQHQTLVGDLMDYLKRIKEESESVRVVKHELREAELSEKIARAWWVPRIDFEAKAGYEPILDRPNQGSAGSVRGMILARFDLFTGFETHYNIKGKTAHRMRKEAELKKVLLKSVTDTEKFYRRLKAIEARVALEKENAKRALRYYRAVLKEYGRGAKNSSDVRNAARTLIDSRVQAERFKFDFLSQKLQLEEALGGPVKTKVVSS